MSAAPYRLLLCLVVLAGCERAPPPVIEQALRPAKIFTVVAHRATTEHTFVGRLDAAQTVDVSFEVPGELVELPIREGQPVGKGELVAALDPTHYRLAVEEAEVQLRLASQDLERKSRLLREQGISQSIVDDARAQYELGRVRLAQARKRLSDSRIFAPFDAVVARRYLDNRAKVAVGDKVARLLDLNELKVVVSIPEELLATVTPERVIRVSATFDFLPGERFPLQYRESSGEASTVAQTYQVTFTMARPEVGNLLPGMTAGVRVTLAADGADAGVTIPTTALLSAPDGGFFVWKYDPASSRVTRHPVSVGVPAADGIRIRDGLADGDLIIATGASQLQDGMQVRPLNAPETGS
ncbi:MAG: efflux RND transporter periplasmic adaptor subunit [Pseudomonadales bacterium]